MEPVLNGLTIELNWETYEGYYFSHYDIEVRNYSSGSGFGYQEVSLLEIDNYSTTNFTSELPLFSNPIFVVNVYNIFGTRNQTVIEGINQQSTDFIHPGILPINKIHCTLFYRYGNLLF